MDEADRRDSPTDTKAQATIHDLHAVHDDEEVGIEDGEGHGPVVLPKTRHEAHDRQRADDNSQDEGLDRGAAQWSSIDPVVRVAHRLLERVASRRPYAENEDRSEDGHREMRRTGRDREI